MYSKDLQNSPTAGVQERRNLMQPELRSLGQVIACDGSKATVAAQVAENATEQASLWSVGRLVTIAVGANRVIALTRSMQAVAPTWSDDAVNSFHVELELVGEGTATSRR